MYGDSSPTQCIEIGCPSTQLAWGIDSEGCQASFLTPADYRGLAGIFNWTMSAANPGISMLWMPVLNA